MDFDPIMEKEIGQCKLPLSTVYFDINENLFIGITASSSEENIANEFANDKDETEDESNIYINKPDDEKAVKTAMKLSDMMSEACNNALNDFCKYILYGDYSELFVENTDLITDNSLE